MVGTKPSTLLRPKPGCQTLCHLAPLPTCLHPPLLSATTGKVIINKLKRLIYIICSPCFCPPLVICPSKITSWLHMHFPDLIRPACISPSSSCYRQQRDFDYPHGTPALLAWIAGLMCMIPRLGPGGLRDSAGARSDSVDFVTTWHRAQAEGAARRVMPVLKRANGAWDGGIAVVRVWAQKTCVQARCSCRRSKGFEGSVVSRPS